MIGLYFKNFSRGIIYNLILLFPLSILAGICMVNFYAAVIVPTIFNIAIIIFCSWLLIFNDDSAMRELIFGIEKDMWFVKAYELKNYLNGEYGRDFVRNIADGKTFSIWGAVIWTLLHLIIATGCIICFVLFLKTGLFANQIQGNIVYAILIQTAIIQILFFIIRTVCYLKASCLKCRRIFCLAEVSRLSDIHRGKYSKTKTTNENVGSLYAGDKKIGNVYQRSTTTENYTTFSSNYKYNCSCIHCSNKRQIQINNFIYYKNDDN